MSVCRDDSPMITVFTSLYSSVLL